jgi:predicted nuclease with TOPRIM domain
VGFQYHSIVYDFLSMADEDRSEVLRNQIEELREEAGALVDRAKKTARHADDLAERIKNLENQLVKKKH